MADEWLYILSDYRRVSGKSSSLFSRTRRAELNELSLYPAYSLYAEKWEFDSVTTERRVHKDFMLFLREIMR